MTEERYFQWMTVWGCIQGSTSQLPPSLYDKLNEMWQQDRKGCTEGQLATYAGAWANRNNKLEQDPKFLEFMRGLDKAFGGPE
jgi:hypothetical protein